MNILKRKSSLEKSKDKLNKMLHIKPVHGTDSELQEWRLKVKKLERGYEKEWDDFNRKRKEQWEPGEWEGLEKLLQKLSLEQLRKITDKVGINFSIGNKNIKDKREFVLVLDEADKKELYGAYNKIIKSK